jgi:hypothetical protein
MVLLKYYIPVIMTYGPDEERNIIWFNVAEEQNKNSIKSEFMTFGTNRMGSLLSEAVLCWYPWLLLWMLIRLSLN